MNENSSSIFCLIWIFSSSDCIFNMMVQWTGQLSHMGCGITPLIYYCALLCCGSCILLWLAFHPLTCMQLELVTCLDVFALTIWNLAYSIYWTRKKILCSIFKPLHTWTFLTPQIWKTWFLLDFLCSYCMRLSLTLINIFCFECFCLAVHVYDIKDPFFFSIVE